jgi:hypothetical protein
MIEKRKCPREGVFGVNAIAKVNSAPRIFFKVRIVNYCPEGIAFVIVGKEVPTITKGDYVTILFNKGELEEMECLFEIMYVDKLKLSGCRLEMTRFKKAVRS